MNETKTLPCPGCSFSLEFSVIDLLNGKSIVCPNCHAHVKLDNIGEK